MAALLLSRAHFPLPRFASMSSRVVIGTTVYSSLPDLADEPVIDCGVMLVVAVLPDSLPLIPASLGHLTASDESFSRYEGSGNARILAAPSTQAFRTWPPRSTG